MIEDDRSSTLRKHSASPALVAHCLIFVELGKATGVASSVDVGEVAHETVGIALLYN